MRAYMGFSRCSGPEEGAILIFANSVREAKSLAYRSVLFDGYWAEWTDVAVKWLRKEHWLAKEAIKDTPHVIDNPHICRECELWGQSEIDEDGLCEGCQEEAANNKES